MSGYYVAILTVSVANLALAAVAYVQRAKQVRGNALREHQVMLARIRNELAETRLQRLDDQLAVLAEIRDALCPQNRPTVATPTSIHGRRAS